MNYREAFENGAEIYSMIIFKESSVMQQFYNFLISKNIYIAENIDNIIENSTILVDLIDNKELLIFYLTTFGLNVVCDDKVYFGQSNVYENVGQQPDAIVSIYFYDLNNEKIFLKD